MSDSNLYVTCSKCGKRNPLGRVFCMGCGARLPVDGLLAGEVRREARKARWRQGLVRLLVVVALGGIVVGLIQALRVPDRVYDVGGEADAKQFEQNFRSFRVIDNYRSQGFSIDQTLIDIHVNAFLRLRSAENASDAEYRFCFSPAVMHVQRVRPLRLPAGLDFITMPVIAVELRYTRENGKLVSVAGRVGRLPLPSPLRAQMDSWFQDDLRNRSEWSVLRHLRCIELGEGTITLALMPEH